MSNSQLVRKSDIEMKFDGSSVYAENVSLLQLEKFADLIRKDERELMIGNILSIFKQLDKQANGQHTYWKMAYNLIEQELGDD
jgi:hypothetical protein